MFGRTKGEIREREREKERGIVCLTSRARDAPQPRPSSTRSDGLGCFVRRLNCRPQPSASHLPAKRLRACTTSTDIVLPVPVLARVSPPSPPAPHTTTLLPHHPSYHVGPDATPDWSQPTTPIIWAILPLPKYPPRTCLPPPPRLSLIVPFHRRSRGNEFPQ